MDRLLRNEFGAFVQKVFKTVSPASDFLDNWHIDLMCEHLVALRDGSLGKSGLIINIPPRYLKSITVTVAWPTWLIGHNPAEQIVCCSYSQDLAYEHSMARRLVVQQPWYQSIFPDTKIARDQNEKREFKLTWRGHCQATSVEGSVTGFGGNWLIVDDPHDPTRADSDKLRASGLKWLAQTWSSRFNDKKNGKEVVVMQRLHERDYTGYLLAEQGGDYHHLMIEGVATEQTIIDFGRVKKARRVGDVLHPEREGAVEIARIRRKLGERGFAGQYQQSPQPEGGGILKSHWWRRWIRKDPPECEFVFQSYDTAFTKKHSDDIEPSYSARTTWGVFRQRDEETEETHYCLIMLEAWHDMIEYADLRKEAKKSAKDYEPDVLLIEAKASGQALVSDLRRAGLPVREYRPQRYEDKVVRAYAVQPYFEAGRVYTMDRQWAEEGPIAECSSFPTGAHDDWVDTVTQAVQYVCRGWWLEHPDDEDDEDDYDPHALDEQRSRSYG